MAPKRRLRRKMCEGKVRHKTIEAAWVATYILRKKGHNVRPYKCRFCGGYHVGHYKNFKADERKKG